MSAVKLFTFFIMNGTTREIATILGQGETMEEAFSEACKNQQSKFRPDSGGGGTVLDLNVRLPDGRNVARAKKAFESDHPFADKPEDHEPEVKPELPLEEDCPL